MTHLIVFDIDGTLTLTNDMDGCCYVRAMSEHLGCPIDDDWSNYRNVTDSGIAAELLSRHQRDRGELTAVRSRFISLLTQSLATNPAGCRQVCGADRFLRRLRKTPGVVVGLATGGWAESALAKLRHADVDVDDLAFASADDADARTVIMTVCQQRAASSAGVDRFATVSYIGDGLWDAQAAAALGWRFIGIGRGPHAARLRSAGACHVFEDFGNEEAVLHALDLI